MERARLGIGINVVLAINLRCQFRYDLHRLEEPVHLQSLFSRAAVYIVGDGNSWNLNTCQNAVVVTVTSSQRNSENSQKQSFYILLHNLNPYMFITSNLTVQRYGVFPTPTIAQTRHSAYHTWGMYRQ